MTIANTSGPSAKVPGQSTASANSRVRLQRWTLPAPLVIVLVVLWICLIDNGTLWSELHDRLAPVNGSSLGYAAALLALMLVLLCIPLLLIGQRYLLKPLLIALLFLCGVLAYFTGQLGVVYDLEMVRNVAETVKDSNTQEGMELLSLSMLRSLMSTTALPVLLLMMTRLNYGSWVRDSAIRLAWGAGLMVVAVTLVMFNFKSVTYFSRENNDLEVYLTPFYPMKTAGQLLVRQHEARNFVFNELGDDAVRDLSGEQRTVGIVVVGETARRSNQSLNGYSRNTNPELSRHQIVNFRNATSCGTSTAFSVPCMFSFLGQADYTPELAGQQSNVLDVLQKSGVKVIWVDSNSSCKGVCRRIENTNLLSEPDPDNALFVDGAWHDEILLEHVDRYLDDTPGDVLLVLHSMGSHGPAYYRRYPQAFASFGPSCQSKAPQECSAEEILNAYDNTILYTDHVLASLIDRLDARNDQSFLFYASDHGESLGENGVYLHGLPRIIAPATQSEVPMLAWLSPELVRDRNWAVFPSQVIQVDQAVSHDNISGTLLGLYRIQTSLYEPSLDLFGSSLMMEGHYNVALDESVERQSLSINSVVRQ